MKLKDGFEGEQSIVLPEMVINMMEKDAMTAMLHISDMGFYPKAAHHYRHRPKPLDQYIFIYCIDGEGWYELNGRRCTVTANQYFVLPAGAPHTYAASASQPWSIYWIHFRGTLAEHYARHATSPQTIMPGLNSRIHRRHELFDEIFSTLQQSLTIESLRYAMAAFHHYLASLLYIKVYRTASARGRDIDVADAVIHYMEENIGRVITLADLSAYSGFSQSRLSAIFKERTGHSPINYFNLLRVRHACRLLETTALRLSQISPKLGFSDPLYFSRLFSKIMGLSPIAYRNRPKG